MLRKKSHYECPFWCAFWDNFLYISPFREYNNNTAGSIKSKCDHYMRGNWIGETKQNENEKDEMRGVANEPRIYRKKQFIYVFLPCILNFINF